MISRDISESPISAGLRGAERIAGWSRESIASRGSFSIALAGGEGPRLLYEALSARTDIDFGRWWVLFGDERAVNEGDPRSNALNAHKWLLDRVSIAPERVFRMVLPGLDPESLALRYEKTLDEVLGPQGRIDLVLLGLGKDAHTLSLYPGCPEISERSRRVVALKNPPMDPAVDRISFTPKPVISARRVMVIAHGASKAEALRAAIEGPEDRSGVPSQLIRDATGEVIVLMDRAALGA